MSGYYNSQKAKLLPLTKREEFFTGLGLYWGEGNKSCRNTLSINNTDPSMIKFALHWITRCLEVPKDKVRVQVHLYSDMDVEKELNFWSREINIPRNQFAKPYIKSSHKADIDQKGFGHGTCGLLVYNTILKENTLSAMKVLSKVYSEEVKI